MIVPIKLDATIPVWANWIALDGTISSMTIFEFKPIYSDYMGIWRKGGHFILSIASQELSKMESIRTRFGIGNDNAKKTLRKLQEN